jgi:hypothetical protein
MRKVITVKLFRVFAVLAMMSLVSSPALALVIPEPWVFSVVYISNISTGKSGTGFLISRMVGEDSTKVFLVTNKHVLLPDRPVQGKMESMVFLNRLEDGSVKVKTIPVTLTDAGGKRYWRSHPKEEIDIAVLDFTPYISEDRALMPDLKIGFIPEDKFATKEIIDEEFISIGDRVVVLGYPLNLIEGGHSIPIARDGVIASHPSYDFRDYPAVLIDSTMVRGSSGSPVFLPVLPYKWTSPTNMNTSQLTQTKFLGIVSKIIPDWTMEIKRTDFFGQEPRTVSVVDTANMGIVLKAETISETIDQFGYPEYKR